MFKKIATAGIFVFFIVFLFVLSEAVFIWNHPSQITTYGFSLARYYANRGETEKSLKTVAKTSYYYQKLNTKKMFDASVFDIKTEDIVHEKEFINNYQKYIKNLQYTQLMPSGLYDYPRFIYEIGLIALVNGNKNLTYQLWTIANTIDPTLSYWPVELANLYESDGNHDMATKILEDCSKHDYPKNHCTIFLTETIEPSESLKPGFLLAESEKYYKFKSVLFGLFPENFNVPK